MRNYPVLAAAVAVVALLLAAPLRAPAAASTLPNKPVPVDTKQAAVFLTQLAAQKAAQLGIKTGMATCPAKVVAKPNAVTRFQCTVPYEGQLAPYEVTIDTAKARFDTKPGMAILATRLVVAFVETNVTGVKKVDCGKPKVLIRPPKGTVTCSVNGGAAVASVRVEDVEGRITLTGVV